MYGETVSIRRHQSSARDAHGNPASSWGEPEPIEGCFVAPSGSSEQVEPGRNAVITGYTVYAPPGVVVGHRDKADCRGETWFVDGVGGAWVNPYTGEAPGVQFALTMTRG